MGSEMCIRDRLISRAQWLALSATAGQATGVAGNRFVVIDVFDDSFFISRASNGDLLVYSTSSAVAPMPLRVTGFAITGPKGDKGDPGDSAVRRSRVIQAPVAAADTAGVASITLPADYATYHDLSIAGWETADDSMFAHDIPTDILAAQTQTRSLTIAGNPGAGGATVASWDPSTRVLTATQQRNAPWRIIKAELHD